MAWIIERGEREILTLTLRVPVKLIIFMIHAHAIARGLYMHAAAARAAHMVQIGFDNGYLSNPRTSVRSQKRIRKWCISHAQGCLL